MRCKFLTVAMAVTIVLTTGQVARAQPKIKTEYDVVYGKVGERELKLDLAMPSGDAKARPLVICLHGGGWRLGNKKELRNWLEGLAESGYVAASVGYRLAPDHVFPAQIEDCKTAVRFLRANSEKYGINKERVAAMGWSAGGHLACLLGLTTPDDGFEGTLHAKESSKVQAVIDYFGPTDLSGYAKDAAAQRGMLGPFIGAKFDEKPEAHVKASPIKYVRAGAPPFLVLHGTKDWIVPIEQSRSLVTKLKEVKAPVELIEVDGEGHGWNGKPSADTTRATFRFLREHLQK